MYLYVAAGNVPILGMCIIGSADVEVTFKIPLVIEFTYVSDKELGADEKVSICATCGQLPTDHTCTAFIPSVPPVEVRVAEEPLHIDVLGEAVMEVGAVEG